MTPSEAANVTNQYLSQRASSELVMETLNAIASADVKLTPSFKGYFIFGSEALFQRVIGSS